MRKDDNELITRVGPYTAMGAVFRSYWTPITVARQLEKKDSDPVRIRFAGENYVAFRDSEGRLGLLDELCTHRGASLALGRVEGCGIRCLYHGWKYAVDGTILETPNHRDPAVRTKLKAPAYSIREAGGLIWGYFGPKEKEPPFPDFAFFHVPPEHRTEERIDVACNYLQLLEGGVDSSHVGILHKNQTNLAREAGKFERNLDVDNPAGLAFDDDAPELFIETTDFGFHYAAARRGPADQQSVRIVPFFMPCGRLIPAAGRIAAIFEVPIDDTHTSTFLVAYADHPLYYEKNRKISGLWQKRFYDEATFKWTQKAEERWGQDRSVMADNFTGFSGLEPEDAGIALSMGPIYDRSREHLVPADAAVVHLRRLLLAAARGAADGREPPRLPHMRRITAIADTELVPGQSWQSLAPDHRPASEDAPLPAVAE